jgi:uncharacterized SAM-binding protein YcdF (DUF218 family)
MKKKFITYKALSVTALSALPYAAMAATQPGINPVIPAKGADFNSVAHAIIGLLLAIAAAIAVIVLIIGGLRYLISSGDSGQIEKAKHTIQYAIIGLIVIIFAFVIYNTVNTLGSKA